MSTVRDMLVTMAICQDCEQEMRTASSCTVSALHVRGVAFDLFPFGQDGAAHRAGRSRCGDCGVQPGGWHHLGCDMMRCPRCRGQLLGCGCPFDEFAAEADQDDDEGYDESRHHQDLRSGVVGLAVENPCPVCGSDSVNPILYGRPNPATESLSEKGLVELAGGHVDGAQPSSRCRVCNHAWTRRTG